jgi:hypothetical protein
MALALMKWAAYERYPHLAIWSSRARTANCRDLEALAVRNILSLGQYLDQSIAVHDKASYLKNRQQEQWARVGHQHSGHALAIDTVAMTWP